MKKILISLLLIFAFSLISCAAPPRTSTSAGRAIKLSLPALTETPILQIDTGGHKAKIQDIMFTNDGRYLVSASDDKTIRVWNVKSGEIVRTIRGQIGEGPEGKIYAAALSPNNQLLAVGGFMAHGRGIDDDKVGNIRLINFRTGEIVQLLKGHSNVIQGLAFSTDNRYLISGSADKTARIWDLGQVLSQNSVEQGFSLAKSKPEGLPYKILKGHANFINAVAFSPDGKRAVTGSDDNTLKLWDADFGSPTFTMKGHTDNVQSVAFTPDGRYILSGSKDKTIRLWDGKSGRFIKVLARQDSSVNSLSITPNGTKVITGHGCCSADSPNNIFSIPSGEQVASFTKHDNIVLATAVSTDGKIAATGGGNDQEIYLWDIDTGRVKQKMVGKGKKIWSVGFARDGRSIAWGKMYNQSGYDMYQINGPLEQSLHLNDSGQNVLQGFSLGDNTAGQDFSLALGKEFHGDTGYLRAMESVGPYSIRTKNSQIHPTLQILRNNKVIHQIMPQQSGDNLYSLTLTPNGNTILTGTSWDLTAFSADTGKELRKFVGHTGVVWGVAVSPDSRYLVSGSTDQTVRLWEINSGKLLLTIFHGTDNEWVAWTPEGHYTSSVNGDKYIGWHINRGEAKSALYYPASKFAKNFYSPEIVAYYLDTGGDIDEAVRRGGR